MLGLQNCLQSFMPCAWYLYGCSAILKKCQKCSIVIISVHKVGGKVKKKDKHLGKRSVNAKAFAFHSAVRAGRAIRRCVK